MSSIEPMITPAAMQHALSVYNTLTGQRTPFEPQTPPFVGMYVCGPTLYKEAHLGHARSAINFDVIQRYLKHIGYQVRYVRNVTDVGHLTDDADEGIDKVSQQAQVEKRTPMEIVQRYGYSYRRDMDRLNVQPPSIEPQASGHIIEQISTIQEIKRAGLAYATDGSVYFDMDAYMRKHTYGRLSGHIPAQAKAGTRPLAGQAQKRNELDFALWKKAGSAHSMQWSSPWGVGFPGWHIACTAMSTKYLGKSFDIHGGGMDLIFPHHECEWAQAQAAYQTPPAKYWLHNNVITIAGQKMSKSKGNAITLAQLFSGMHPNLTQAYSPMALRLFVLQAHYRSLLHFSEEALRAAHNGYRKLMHGLRVVHELAHAPVSTAANPDKALVAKLAKIFQDCYAAMNDDFNTAKVLSALFELLKYIHALKQHQLSCSALGPAIFQQLQITYRCFVEDILGLKEDLQIPPEALLHIVRGLYQDAKAHRQYDRVDHIRADLKRLGITLQDTPTGIDWYYS